MGAEGVPWIGLAPFVDEPHLIQNLGDGTLSHSGTLAIRASVAAGVNVTFKILYNAAVAMTGGQDVTGLMDVPSLSRALDAEGVAKIVVCAEDPKHYGRRARWANGVEVTGRDGLEEAQERLRQVDGVSVIVFDQRCAAEARRLRKRGLLEEPPRRVVINEAVCEGCGDCSSKSNCLSVLPVETELGTKRQIHDLSCNRDYTCLEGDCPSFVTLAPTRRSRKRPARASRRRSDRAPLPPGSIPPPTPRAVDGQYGIYLTGIGGTGVVTANRIIAAAAESAGLAIRGMDQTGLSQKAGAVASHLHLATDQDSLGAASISTAGADLYLSGDILQAAGAQHLAKVRAGRTIAVIDRDLTPTAAMLQTSSELPDVGLLEAQIEEVVGRGQVFFVDSTKIAELLLSNAMLANVVLLGAAYQLGGLPVSLEDVDEAMERQGRLAAENRAAFAWGRWAVHDPAVVEARLAEGAIEVDGDQGRPLDPSVSATDSAAAMVSAKTLPHELEVLLTRRAAQVIDYQSIAVAERFLELVAQVATADESDQGWALTRAVTESWFKLLTYKDEYEVARLHLKVDYDHVAAELGIEGPYSVTYHLHPPTLRRLGRRTKLPLGTPYRLSFHVLRRMRRLRGTPFDVFGWDPERRLERALIEEYRQLVEEMLDRGSSLPYDQKVQLAASALAVKGYGPIKVAAIEAWRVSAAELRAPVVTARDDKGA
jgi:indolepyruvate ferredoxin oxidoreductase